MTSRCAPWSATRCTWPTRPDAVAISRAAGVIAVALDGTVARPDGVVSGGSGDDVASGMIEQKREMKRAARGRDAARSRAHARASRAHRAAHPPDRGGNRARARSRASSRRPKWRTLPRKRTWLAPSTRSSAPRTRIAKLGLELTDIDASLAQAAVLEASNREAQLDGLRTQLELLNQELARAESTAAAWRERVATQLSLVTERKVRLAQVKEQVEAARAALERVATALIRARSARHQARRRAERSLGRLRPTPRRASWSPASSASKPWRPPSWRTPNSTKRARCSSRYARAWRAKRPS